MTLTLYIQHTIESLLLPSLCFFTIYHVAFQLGKYKIRVSKSVEHVSMHGSSGSLFVATKVCNKSKWQGEGFIETLPTREMK
jgi:hypothetical protein